MYFNGCQRQLRIGIDFNGSECIGFKVNWGLEWILMDQNGLDLRVNWGWNGLKRGLEWNEIDWKYEQSAYQCLTQRGLSAKSLLYLS